MAEVITERKRERLESKIEGADKVEIKTTIKESDEQRAYEALEIGRRDAVRREIYFFDTPELTLSTAGVVLRARAIEDDDHDSVVKIRPVDPAEVGLKWQEEDGFKIEADVVGEKIVTSASLKRKQKKDAIEKVVEGKDPISELFSKKQRKLIAEFYDGPVELDDLTVLGPVKTLRADIERSGLAYELTAEYWTLPDDSHVLEVSIKCPIEEGVVAGQVFDAFLGAHGLDPHGAQATKTALALKGLVKQLEHA